MGGEEREKAVQGQSTFYLPFLFFMGGWELNITEPA